jgi:hypothetical protein
MNINIKTENIMSTFLFDPNHIKSKYQRTLAVIFRHYCIYTLFLSLILSSIIYLAKTKELVPKDSINYIILISPALFVLFLNFFIDRQYNIFALLRMFLDWVILIAIVAGAVHGIPVAFFAQFDKGVVSYFFLLLFHAIIVLPFNLIFSNFNLYRGFWGISSENVKAIESEM